MIDPSQLGTGWIPDEQDERDHTPTHPRVATKLEATNVAPLVRRGDRKRLPARMDLRQWAPPVKFQGGFNTCSPHVVAALMEYFEQRAFGKQVAVSRLFLYKVGKNFLDEAGDPGIYIRQTMGVLKMIGAPPEKYWPYPDPGTPTEPKRHDPRLDEEPTSFCYALAGDFRAEQYYRLDPLVDDLDRPELLLSARAHLAASTPFTLGFPLFGSIAQASKSGEVPFPGNDEKQLGRHAVVAFGYDDAMTIRNETAGTETTGAFLVQNSWSDQWGDGGYGYLPYEFLLAGLARDMWTLSKASWTDTGEFQLDLGA